MWINIDVRKTDKYKEVTFKHLYGSIMSGFLDRDEAVEMAKVFISAAEDLLQGEHDDELIELVNIREHL